MCWKPKHFLPVFLVEASTCQIILIPVDKQLSNFSSTDYLMLLNMLPLVKGQLCVYHVALLGLIMTVHVPNDLPLVWDKSQFFSFSGKCHGTGSHAITLSQNCDGMAQPLQAFRTRVDTPPAPDFPVPQVNIFSEL